MNKTRFSMPVIFVNSIETSKKFYQDIFALEIEQDFGENIVFKNSISLWQKKCAEEIIFGSVKENRFEKGIKAIELYFQTGNVETVYNILKGKNVEMIHGLKEENWGQKTIRFYDPDKFIIEVAEPIENVVLRFSKSGMSDEEVSKKTQMPLEIVKKIIKDKNK